MQLKHLAGKKIICLFNKDYGDVKELPFDINHNRITVYNGNKGATESKRISEIIFANIKSLFYDGKLFNPLIDYMKQKIDYNFLYIIERIVQVFNHEKDIDYSLELIRINDLTPELLATELNGKRFLGFYLFQDYTHVKHAVECILDKLFMSTYFNDIWKEVLVELVEWIVFWGDMLSERCSPNLAINQLLIDDYRISNMDKANESNPKGSVLLLKNINKEKYRAIKGGYLLCDEHIAISLIQINPAHSGKIINKIKQLFNIVDKWLEISGGEFILDPQFYKVNA